MKIRTTTLTNQNISSYLLIDTYTITDEREYIIRVLLNQISGNGKYTIYAEVQRDGTGPFYRYDDAGYVVPSGVTSVAIQTILTSFNQGDIVKLYVEGTPSDTTTVDIVIDWFYLNYSTTNPSEIWNYVERTLTSNFTTSTPTDKEISCIRGDTFTYTFNGIDLTDYNKLYFTVKKAYKDEDPDSIIQIDSETGLLYINGCKSTTGIGGEIIVDEPNEKVTVIIEATISKQLEYNISNYFYDLEIVKIDADVFTPKYGTFIVVRDVTRKII